MQCLTHMITTYISDEDKNRFLTNTINAVYNHLNELPGPYDQNPVRQFFGGEEFSKFKTQIGSAKTATDIEEKKVYARAALDHWQFGLFTRTLRVSNLLFYVVLLRNVIVEFMEHPDDVWSRDSETNKIVTVKRDEYFARQNLSHDEQRRRGIATRSLRLRIHKLLCDM
jgi:hypothetical protein